MCNKGDVQAQNGNDIESLSPKCLPPCTAHHFPVRHSSYLALTAFSGKAFLSLTPQSCAPSSALMDPRVARPPSEQSLLCAIPNSDTLGY